MDYHLIRSARKTIAIEVRKDGSVIVRAPQRCSRGVIEGILKEKQDWILRKKKESEERAQEQEKKRRELPAWSEADEQRARLLARHVLTQKTKDYAALMQVTYGKLTIRDQKTRWGSCSSKGNLNFNWRLILAPEAVLDYVVVHELAHRLEMNHSPAFWKIVEQVLPDYQERRRWLKEHGEELMMPVHRK